MPETIEIERMPFGKHKGVPIDKLPTDYLKWLAENIREDTPINKAVCLAADREYLSRGEDDDEYE